MGTILNAQMAALFAPIFSRFASVAQRLPHDIAPANVLLTPELRATLPVAFLDQLEIALSQALFWVYALIVVLALAAVLTVFFLPGGRAEKYTYKEEGVEANEEPVSEPLAHLG
jgi:hypothetical protein